MIYSGLLTIVRTKWKRQNQLRLDQLRQQTSGTGTHSLNNSLLKDFQSEQAASEAGAGAGAVAPLNYCPSSTLASLEVNGNPFLTTAAAAAAIFRNVSYVHHRCPI